MDNPTGRHSAELIADVVADIRAAKVYKPAEFVTNATEIGVILLERARRQQPVVDCTAIFKTVAVAEAINIYDDYPTVTPPWGDALLCFVDEFDTVICLQVHRIDHDGHTPTGKEWRTDNPVDWSKVRWIGETAVWVGGSTINAGRIPVCGPYRLFRHAINADGSASDINWVAFTQPREPSGAEATSQEAWHRALAVLNAALNFLNAVNIETAEPARPRPVRRRIQRTGVTVQTIVVRPPGKRRPGGADTIPLEDLSTPLHPVRGHFSHYGPEYGRGLLFGRIAGKFWIPGHARGFGDDDGAPRDYVLRPTTTRSR